MVKKIVALAFAVLMLAASPCPPQAGAMTIPEPPGASPNMAAHNEAIELLKRGELAGVVELERRVLDLDPGDLTARFILALACLGLDDEKGALEQAQKALETDPGFALEIYGAMGRSYATNRRYHKALVYFREALRIDDDPAIIRHVASIYLGQGLIKNAKKYFERLLDTEPDYMNLSRIYLAEADFEMAAEYAREALKADPRATGAYLVLGTAHLMNGKTDESQANFMILSQTNPEFFLTSYFLGVIGLARSDYDGALRSFHAFIDMTPRLQEGYLNAAAAHHAKGDLEKALEMAEKAVEEDPLDPFSRMALGSVLASLGRDAIALEELGKAADTFPEFHGGSQGALALLRDGDGSPARFTLAMLFNRAGLYRQTIRLVAPDEGNQLLLVLRARALERLGVTGEAEALYRKLIKGRPSLASAHLGLGDLLEARKEHLLAAKHYGMAASTAPGHSRLRASIARSYSNAGKADMAIEQYRLMLSESPGATAPYLGLAALMADKKGRLEEALEFASQARVLNPEDGEIRDTLGWIYYRMGRYEEALEAYSGMENKGSPSPAAYYHLGLVYEKLGRPEKARAAFEKALNLNDEFPESPEAKKRLKKLSRLG